MDKVIEEQEKKTFEEDDSVELPPPDVIAYNELRSCADLNRMYKEGILNIQPEFQREIVWKGPEQTRFIDSLIKQLPIPSMCFSMDYKTQKWQVIDGLQRMVCIIKFLGGDPSWSLSQLGDIDSALSGTPVIEFHKSESKLYNYYQRVANLTLPITVLRCDYSKKSHVHYLFTIFHRLNSGGTHLNNQEIRNCIYSGPFNDLLKELNKTLEWMRLNRMKKDTGYRFTKEELILRFFAFYDRYEQYTGKLAKFLNDYMDDNKQIKKDKADEKIKLFKLTIEIVYKKIHDSNAPTQNPISISEATLVGVGRNIDTVEKLTMPQLKSRYEKMLKHTEFSEERLKEGLAGKERVTGRMKTAIETFS